MINHKTIKMKKLLLVSLALVASLNLAQAQDQIYWSEVSMVVEPGNQGLVAQAVNDFYSSIDFPENSSVTLNAWQAKTEWREGTHFLNFAGSVEGMSKLRECVPSLHSVFACQAFNVTLEFSGKSILE